LHPRIQRGKSRPNDRKKNQVNYEPGDGSDQGVDQRTLGRDKPGRLRGDRGCQQRSNTQKPSRCGANQHQEGQLCSTLQRLGDGHECLPLPRSKSTEIISR